MSFLYRKGALKMSNTIGVVLATYNGELYVEQQLRSIIGQTKKPTMIIVSDGGSTDRTIEVCSAVLEDSGISSNILVSDTQLSAAANFEKALNHCDCDIIFFSDQDDVWMPNKIELLTQAMEKNDCCLAFANAFITDSSLKQNGKEKRTSL